MSKAAGGLSVVIGSALALQPILDHCTLLMQQGSVANGRHATLCSRQVAERAETGCSFQSQGHTCFCLHVCQQGSNLFWFESPTSKKPKCNVPLEGATVHVVRPPAISMYTQNMLDDPTSE